MAIHTEGERRAQPDPIPPDAPPAEMHELLLDLIVGSRLPSHRDWLVDSLALNGVTATAAEVDFELRWLEVQGLVERRYETLAPRPPGRELVDDHGRPIRTIVSWHEPGAPRCWVCSDEGQVTDADHGGCRRCRKVRKFVTIFGEPF